MNELATDRLRTAVEGVSNLLVVAPRPHAVDDTACVGLLSGPGIADAHVVAVTYTQSSAERLAVWDAHSDTRPAETAVIDVGGVSRPSPPGQSSRETHPPGVTVETVGDAGDLTGLGVAITKQFDEWGDDADVRLCFHSLTALLQYVPLERAARFLQVLTDRVETVGATAHYHLQPDAHEDQTIETLAAFVDAVATVTEDGELRVRE